MNQTVYVIPASDIAGLVPEVVLCGGGVLVLLFEAFAPRLRRWTHPLAVLTTLASMWAAATGAPIALGTSSSSFGGQLESSPLTAALSLVILLATLLSVLGSRGFLEREGLAAGEYHALLLWCAAGVLLLTRATGMVTLFVALELLSICLYSLAGYHRRLSVSTEAALKYFLMGAFVSSFVLLGIGLLYGETGSTSLAAIAELFEPGSEPTALALVGLLLLIAGFGFKMSLAPFHAWAPDTYQGAPSPFVAFLSVAPKAASAMVLLRLLTLAGSGRWPELVAALAVLSMLVGNLLALVQRDIKRMLAYSGIAHMGYLLVPLVSPGPAAYEPLVAYLLAYALMNAGAFVVVGMLYSSPGEQHLIADLGGWGYRRPVLAGCLAISMLSLGGIPPTLGFVGKYVIFLHALDHGHLALMLAIVLTSLIGVFYYLRVVYTLYMRPEVRQPAPAASDLSGGLAALLAAAGTLLLGVLPGRLLEWLDLTTRALS
jgi:NADH-quinone oxidoreductase subunit N